MELISTVKMKKAADIALGARSFALEASGIFSRVADEISMSPYVESIQNTEKNGIFCTDHKKENMIDVKNKK